MTENKMTEAEIMKALECHKEREIDNCCVCPYFTIDGCAYEMSGDVLDLIKSKNAENEVYKNNLEAMAKTMHNSAKATREEARAEAIKEFADRLKEAGAKSVEVAFYGNGTETIEFITLRTNLVDQIAKEMGCGE